MYDSSAREKFPKCPKCDTGRITINQEQFYRTHLLSRYSKCDVCEFEERANVQTRESIDKTFEKRKQEIKDKDNV